MAAEELQAFADCSTSVLAALGGRVNYMGACGTPIATDAIIERPGGLMILEVTLGEPRYIVTLSRADVASPARGDRIELIDAQGADLPAGTVLELSEEQPLQSDAWTIAWSLSKR